MFVATMESENKSWIALGETIEEAKDAILEKWNDDQRDMVQRGWLNSPTYFRSVNKLDEEYGIIVQAIELGECRVY